MGFVLWEWQHAGVVPVADIVRVFPAGTCRRYRETTTSTMVVLSDMMETRGPYGGSVSRLMRPQNQPKPTILPPPLEEGRGLNERGARLGIASSQ